MKIAFITFGDANSLNNWSGAVNWMLRTIRSKYNDVVVIDNIDNFFNPLLVFFIKIVQKISGRSFQYKRMPVLLKMMSSRLYRLIDNQNFDLLFSPSSMAFAYHKTNVSKVFWTDATFNQMIGYYPDYMNLSSRVMEWGNRHEKFALENVDLAIYTSEWAANSAIGDYNINPDKIRIIPFGANVVNNCSTEEITDYIDVRVAENILKLLIVGLNWSRKGFEIAIQIAADISARGIEVELHMVGASAPYNIKTPFKHIHYGSLSKSNEDHAKLLNRLYLTSHFFVLPSVAECAGIVFAEASSFGLPSITRNTGGIPTMVKDGLNGYVLDFDAPVSVYADKITEIWNNKEYYKELCYNTLERYNNYLNWNKSSESFLTCISEVI